MTERKAEVTVEELQADGCLSGDCPHGSASDCLDHLTLMIAALRAPASEGEAVAWIHTLPEGKTFGGIHPKRTQVLETPEECAEELTSHGGSLTPLFTHPAPATVTEAGELRQHLSRIRRLLDATPCLCRDGLCDECNALFAALGGAR